MIAVLAFTITGIVFVLLGIPLFKRLVPPNYAYGLRVAATLTDKSVWYEANARSGRDFIIVGIAIVVVAVLLFIARVPETVATWINLAFMFVVVAFLVISGWRYANRLSRQRNQAEARSN